MKIQLIHRDAQVPTKGSAKAAGYDLYSVDRQIIHPGERAAISTGICLEINSGWYGRIAPRSGLAAREGLDVMAGVIDADYRGEIMVLLVNLGKLRSVIDVGDRVAQIIFEQCWSGPFDIADLRASDRGCDGFGSTGK